MSEDFQKRRVKLRALSREFQVGRIDYENYRRQRSVLLGELETDSPAFALDDDATRPQPRTAPHQASQSRSGPLARPSSRFTWQALLVVLIAIPVMIGASVFWWGDENASLPLFAGHEFSPYQLDRITHMTEILLDTPEWEVEDIQRFVLEWRGLKPDQQALMRNNGRLRLLRNEIEYRIVVLRRLPVLGLDRYVYDRLAMLEQFASELDET
ncbi:MAG: hypothetical protein SVU69_10270 [Pseudomonadota bacterium]|nr:hypothetical protein [Pseudomonadota bacterium]